MLTDKGKELKNATDQIPATEQSKELCESRISEPLTRLTILLKTTSFELPSEYDTATIKIFFEKLTARLQEEYLETEDPDPNIYRNAIETIDRASIESGELTSSREKLEKLLTMTERMKEAIAKPLSIHINDSQEDELALYWSYCPQNDWVIILPTDSNKFHISWGQNNSHVYRGGNHQIDRLADRIRKENGICELAQGGDDRVHGINGTLTMGGSIKISVSTTKNNRSATVTFFRRNHDCQLTPRYARQILKNNMDKIIEALCKELKVESVTIEFEDFDSQRAN